MTFAKMKKNREAAAMLMGSIRNGSVHHAYIIEGSDKKERKSFALSFAQALLCMEKPAEGCGRCPVCRRIAQGGHVDVTMVYPDIAKSSKKKSIKTNAVTAVQNKLSMAPYEAERNIVIIDDADTMSEEAENKFLKTLEEPAPGTVIMMLVENSETLLSTVLSRAMHIRLEGTEGAASGKREKQAAELVSALADKEPYYKIRKLIGKISKDAERGEISVMLDHMEQIYREHMVRQGDPMKKEYIFNAVSAVEKARKDILGSIVVANALKDMALAIGG